METLIFVSAWLAFGAAAATVSIRKSARFNRALDLKYPLVADYKGVDGAAIGFAVAFGLLGPFGLIGILVAGTKHIVGEPYWTQAKHWRPTEEQKNKSAEQRIAETYGYLRAR